MRTLKCLISLCTISLLLLASMAYSMEIRNRTGTKLSHIQIRVASYHHTVCHTKKDFKQGKHFHYRPSVWGACYDDWGGELYKYEVYNVDKKLVICDGIKIGSDVYLNSDSKKKCTVRH